MYVKNKMTANPYTVEKDAGVTDAIALMHEKGLKRLPVVECKKLVGIITQTDIQTVSPTKATTLSVYEINYLLSKTLIKDVMTKDVITVSEDSLIEEAVVLMRDNDISSLVVTDDDNHVEGIITESNIFDSFIDMLGYKKQGTRISVETDDQPGELAEIAKVFGKHKANITNVVCFSGANEKAEIVLRTSSVNTSEIEKDIKELGYDILSVIETIDE